MIIHSFFVPKNELWSIVDTVFQRFIRNQIVLTYSDVVSKPHSTSSAHACKEAFIIIFEVMDPIDTLGFCERIQYEHNDFENKSELNSLLFFDEQSG